jgi:hypothetical protein
VESLDDAFYAGCSKRHAASAERWLSAYRQLRLMPFAKDSISRKNFMHFVAHGRGKTVELRIFLMPLMSSRSLIDCFKVQLDKKAAALLSFCNNMKIWFFTFMVLFDTLKYHLWYFTIISIVLGIYEKNARE